MTKTKLVLASVLVLGSATLASADETVVTSLYQPSVYAQSHQQDARGAYAFVPAQAVEQAPLTNRIVW